MRLVGVVLGFLVEKLGGDLSLDRLAALLMAVRR
jgi:hypothetical protein